MGHFIICNKFAIMDKGTILVVDDDEDILTTTEVLLENEGFSCFTIKHPKDSYQIIKKNRINVILLDMNYIKGYTDGKEGIQWLNKFKTDFNEIPIIPITAYSDIELAVKAVKNGAFDFILKPWDNKKFLCTISSALVLNKTKSEKKNLEEIQQQLKDDHFNKTSELIGESAEILKVKQNIAKVSKSEANVLIIGENGTGKEIAGRLIHSQSDRKNEIFYRIDIPSIQANLFESELFGFEKGAFTDAKESKPGKLEIANKGTLFLDEISFLTLNQQAKLLSVFQNRKITRLGSTVETDLDIRIICATSKSIKELINSGEFREDLFFRINTFELYIPALKDRDDDIEILSEHYIKFFAKQYNKPKLNLNSKTLNKLKKHTWPGNIRELKNVIERAVILSDGNTLDISQVFISSELYNQSKDVTLNLAEMEKKWILMAIEKHHGNMTKAAKELGLKRSSFYRRLEKYEIK
ncbi:MAG: sigma-54-dependent Fis family transcriptional regulator [Marinilabiliales bacterium]|nr:MAG: sigma-54-dependent Fis family transcriptional regulator [Marinilabiliales bacterium]